LVLPGVLPKRAYTIARAAVATTAGTADRSPARRVTVGIAGYPRHAHSAAELLEAAERAAEQAVGAGAGEAVAIAADPSVQVR
jgi:GGDEF domain-containing protein